MLKKILQLGTIVTDSVTGLKGMLTHFHIDMSQNQNYLFQPQKLNPETGQPVDTFWANSERLPLAKTIDFELPMDIIGKEAVDLGSGYKGTIIGITLHINGCVHAELKAKGFIKKTGEAIKAIDTDVRRLKIKGVKMLTPTELQASIKQSPSPAPISPRSNR